MSSAFLFRVVCLLGLSLCVPHSIWAQRAYDSPAGRVEVLGLRRWTLEALQDSIARVAPGQKLHDAACIVTLRNSLGFPDAAVTWLSIADDPDGRSAPQQFLIIKLVEPQDSGLVDWLPARPDSFTVLRPAYAAVLHAASDTAGNLWAGRLMWPLQFYSRDSAGRAVALEPGGQAREDAVRLWAFLEAQRTPGSLRTAVATLRSDGTWANRLVAAMVLSNFAASDSAWHALVAALRDPHPTVRDAAALVLANLPVRPVPWDDAVVDLRKLLGGTNVGAMEVVLTVLAGTRIEPRHAADLLRGNGFWIIEHLRAENPSSRRAAEALLWQLNGGDGGGGGVKAWERWIAEL